MDHNPSAAGRSGRRPVEPGTGVHPRPPGHQPAL